MDGGVLRFCMQVRRDAYDDDAGTEKGTKLNRRLSFLNLLFNREASLTCASERECETYGQELLLMTKQETTVGTPRKENYVEDTPEQMLCESCVFIAQRRN